MSNKMCGVLTGTGGICIMPEDHGGPTGESHKAVRAAQERKRLEEDATFDLWRDCFLSSLGGSAAAVNVGVREVVSMAEQIGDEAAAKIAERAKRAGR